MPRLELPPTNGLPIEPKDLLSFGRDTDLSTCLHQLLDLPHPALACSGTVAFIVALRVLQTQQPQRTDVILPAWTCPLVALAVEKIGLTPILCDLAPQHFHYDLDCLKQLSNHNTLAIVITHFAGLVYPFEAEQDIANLHDIFIIEDAAQAMGATYQQQSVGLKGDIAFFSLAFGKGLTSAEGGILWSKHPQIHQQLQQHCQNLPQLKLWETKRCIELLGYSLLYRPATLALIYGNPLRKALAAHDPISAVGDDFDLDSIPIHQLGQWRSRVAAKASQRLPEHWEHARIQAKQRIQQLKQLPHLKIFDECLNSQASFPFLLCLVEDPAVCQKILDELWISGLGITKLFVHAIHQYPNLSHLKTTAPNAVQFADCAFTISNSFWLDDEKFQFIFQRLQHYLN